MIDTVFLTQIATIYTQGAAGKACVVKAAPANATAWGRAYLRSDGFLGIDLREDQPPAELAFTFWHELAHQVLHPPVVARDVPGGIGLDTVDTIKSEAAREGMRAFLLKREQEADAWAAREQARFTAQHGPLERLAVRG